MTAPGSTGTLCFCRTVRLRFIRNAGGRGLEPFPKMNGVDGDGNNRDPEDVVLALREAPSSYPRYGSLSLAAALNLMPSDVL